MNRRNFVGKILKYIAILPFMNIENDKYEKYYYENGKNLLVPCDYVIYYITDNSIYWYYYKNNSIYISLTINRNTNILYNKDKVKNWNIGIEIKNKKQIIKIKDDINIALNKLNYKEIIEKGVISYEYRKS